VNTAAAGRDPFIPKAPRVRGRAITLAVLAHVLLILALAFGVHWRSSQPVPMSAELWSAVPKIAAPRAVAPPPEVVKPAPVAPKPEPVAPPPKPAPVPAPRPDPQIAIEQAKREEAQRARAEQERQEQIRREQAQREREEQRAKEELARKKAAAEKAAAEKAAAEKAAAAKAAAEKAAAEQAAQEKAEKAEAARLAALRDAQMKRMQGLAGATGEPGSTGTAARSSGPSSSYAGRIVARIKPNIVFTDSIDGNPVAAVEVKLAPDGTIVARRLVKSSGVKSWDDAVLRAIDRTGVLPRDVDGRVPPPFQIEFRPRD
jgi:colicin import membrane protein